MTERPPEYPPPSPGGYGHPPSAPSGDSYPPSPSAGPPYPPATPAGYGHYPPAYPPPAPGTNGMAITSLVCGLLTIPLVGLPSIFGLIFGFVALSQIKRTGQPGRGLAIAGIVLSGGFIAMMVVALIIGLSGAANRDRDSDRGTYDSSEPGATVLTLVEQPYSPGLIACR